MKRITLTIALIMTGGAAIAQTPARPPAPEPRLERIDRERAMEEARVERERSLEATRVDRERLLEENRIARDAARLDAERVREESRLTWPEGRAYALAPVPVPMTMPTPLSVPVAALAPMAAARVADRYEYVVAPRSWAPGDPADSLYRVARDLLNRGDYGRAARMFSDLQKNFPKSAYLNDAQYFEAYARYRIGTTDELRAAAKILEPLASRITPSTTSTNATTVTGVGSNTPRANINNTARVYVASGVGFGQGFGEGRRTSDNEILVLYARINGVLAQRGDSDAAAKVAKAASVQGAPCDQEDFQVRSEALNALSQMDPQQALPILRRVLEKKDECSAQLRRNAVFILGRRTDNESAGILMSVAKGDPNTGVRTEAINYLSRIPGDAGLNALEEMLKSEQDERIQRAAVRALMASDNQRARSSMRALIDRKDAPIGLRTEAINSFNSERATQDDAAYLRGLFGKVDNDQLKNSIVNAVARMGGQDNDQWVIQVARNNGESSVVRANALSRLSRSPTITTADLAKLYDASGESFEIRNRIISMLGQRRDQEATDKLIDIVKNSTVITHRTMAINALTNKKDARATQALMDILDGKKP